MWIRLGDKQEKMIVKVTDLKNKWSIIKESLETMEEIQNVFNDKIYNVQYKNDIISNIKQQL